MRKKFLRGKWRTCVKLGRGRKSKQKYRKARGRHNKIREKKKGNPILVAIGFKKPKNQEKEARIIQNIQELESVKKGESVILAKIGQKSKLKIIERAREKEIKILNLNIKKFIKKVERKKKEKQMKMKGKEEKKAKEKKAKPKKEGEEKPKDTEEKPEGVQENKK